MGTRADFYVGRGKDAEWLGSTAWDGYPDGMPDGLLAHTDEQAWRDAITAHLDGRDDGTKPADGWPWPWNTSGTTDYAYAFADGKVWAASFGRGWFDPAAEPTDDELGQVEFPDMGARKNVTFGKRSGVMLIGH